MTDESQPKPGHVGRQRLGGPDPTHYTRAQRAVHDSIVSGPRGMIGGPLPIWLHSPDFAARAQSLGEFCRFKSSLDSRLTELAIITMAAHWRAQFEWYFHAPLAEAAGISAAAIAAIRSGEEPRFDRADEAVVYRFSSELLETRAVGDGTYRQAIEALGEIGVVDLVAVLGYYSLISMTLVAFSVDLPPGADPPFSEA
jgi:4-carboxymuconolactone decarboxylase